LSLSAAKLLARFCPLGSELAKLSPGECEVFRFLAGGEGEAGHEPKFDGAGLFGVESRDKGFGGCSPPTKSLAKADEKSYKTLTVLC
jgi:hypothetical protein